MENTLWLKELAQSEGGVLFGVCETGPFRDRFLLSLKELEGLEYAIVIGSVLSHAVLEGIEDRPTLLYKWHYRQANNLGRGGGVTNGWEFWRPKA